MSTLGKALALSISIAYTVSGQPSKSKPTSPPSPIKSAIALFDAEKLEPAKTAFAPLAAAGNSDAMYYLGRIANEQSRTDSAIAWLEQATKKNDSVSVYHQWLATAMSAKISPSNPFAAMQAAPAVKKEMVRAVELDSMNIDARVNLATFYLQAPAMIGGGVDKARLESATITRLNPYSGKLFEATIAENQKDTVAAEKLLRDLVVAYPDSAQPVVRLAIALSNQKRYDDAANALEGRLKRFPNDGWSLYSLGRLGAVSGTHLDRAQWGLTRYLKAPHVRGNPTFANTHWRLGQVLEAKGDKKTAKSEYEAALQLDPNNAGAKAALDKLK